MRLVWRKLPKNVVGMILISVTTKHPDNIMDHIGEKHGMYTTLEYLGKHMYVCQCECGNIKQVNIKALRSGSTKSCGCRKHRQGDEHPLFRGHKGVGLRYFNRVKLNASKRNIEFNITIEEAGDLLEDQDYKCAMTGWDIVAPKARTLTEGSASIDRIDSSKGYVAGNIQWVHKDINKLKGVFSDEYLIEMCQAIADNTRTLNG